MKHYIIVKFREGYDYRAAIQPIRELFQKALDIDGVLSVEVKPSGLNRENRYDLMIEMTLRPDALRAFDCSEIHGAWKSLCGDVILNKVIFDCDD